MWFPTESCIVVPEVSSMCQSAASPLAACTTAVGADVAVPFGGTPLAAVTTTRRVPPASALLSAYVVVVTPVDAQLAPVASQRCQR